MQEGREDRGFQQLDRERRREEELTAAAYHCTVSGNKKLTQFEILNLQNCNRNKMVKTYNFSGLRI